MTTVARLLRAAVRLDRSSLQVTRGLRYAVGVGAPLLVGIAVNRLIEGVAMSTGALLVGLTDSGAPYRRRVPAMLVASLVVAGSTFVGELVGAHDVLTVVILALASFVTGLCISAGPWTYLVALMGPITFVGAASVPADAPDALGRAALVSAGGLLEVALVLIASRVDPELPERVAVARLYRSVAAWLTRGRAVDDRAPVFLAVAHARDVLDNDRTRDRPLPALTGLGDRIFDELALLHSDPGWWAESEVSEPPAPVLGTTKEANGRVAIVAALNAVADRIARPGARGDPILLTPADHGTVPTAWRLRGVIADIEQAWALTSDLRVRRQRRYTQDASTPWGARPLQVWPGAALAAAIAARRLFALLGANLNLRSSACRHAIRLAVAAALASASARALRLPHYYWVPLTALWLLRPDFGSTFTRGVQRYVGTTAGAVFATLFVATVHPGPYALAILATVLSVGIFCFMLANYGVTGACTTGWVVFVSALAGIPELRAAADRVLDTSIGAVIALGGYLLWPTWERRDVSDAVADVIDAARRYAAVVLGCWLAPDHTDRAAIERSRSDARVTRTNTEAKLARSIAEPVGSPAGLDPDIAAQLLAAMRRFCDGPLALEQSLDTADRQAANPAGHTFLTELDHVMHALADGARTARTARTVEPTGALERFYAAHDSAQRDLDPHDPLLVQARVMVAAVDDAGAALRRLAERLSPRASPQRALQKQSAH
ncbi:MAG: FUSC family protein [Solirubrobacteraceae bacterium]